MNKTSSGRFSEIRMFLGLTQEEMGILMGVDRTTILRWESNSKIIDINPIRKTILSSIGVNPDYIPAGCGDYILPTLKVKDVIDNVKNFISEAKAV